MNMSSNLLQEIQMRPHNTTTFRALPNAWRTKRKIKKLMRKGWQMQGAPTKVGPWNRSHVYVFTRPQVTSAEKKLLGWK